MGFTNTYTTVRECFAPLFSAVAQDLSASHLYCGIESKIEVEIEVVIEIEVMTKTKTKTKTRTKTYISKSSTVGIQRLLT